MRAPGGKDSLRCPNDVDPDATVALAVEVQERRLDLRRRTVTKRARRLAVVLDGGREPAWRAEAVLRAADVLRTVEAGRPVCPEPVDELEVVRRGDGLGDGQLEEERVPAATHLLVGEEIERPGACERNGQRDRLPPSFRLLQERGVDDGRAPVMPDEHGFPTVAEKLVERNCVAGERRQRVVAVGCRRSGFVPTEIRCDGPVPCRGQDRQQLAPRPC